MQIGHYEILEKLGEGGMGVVYRAHDTRLGRDVALKVLRPAVADDPGRLARLQREAQVLASLNHPNIAHLYGIEGNALVMEYVPGTTLRSPLPVDEAIQTAWQIVEALEAAHAKGIVHRDLKPGNIRVTPEGRVKVLDFGLAKALSPEDSSITLSDTPSPDGQSSTSTTLPLGEVGTATPTTRVGTVLGTVAYMSPEQARGRVVDHRTDIWAFGCVLYELLAGRRCFAGETAADVTAAILTQEPDWSLLPPESPVELLRACLQKDVKLRLRHIGDAPLIAATRTAAAAPASAPPRSTMFSPQSAIAAGAVLIALVALGYLWRATRPVARPLQRFTVDLERDAVGTSSFGAATILSPDGSRLVFTGRDFDGKVRLHTRMLDQWQSQGLTTTEDARDPFFSPDGQSVAFFADGKLKRISVLGGAAVTLCDAPDGHGGSWGENDRIIFAAHPRRGLVEVPAAGGAPQPVTELRRDKNEATHRWPQTLSRGEAVLFTASSTLLNFDDASIDVQPLPRGERKTLVQGGAYGRYVASSPSATAGHLLYVRQGTIYAAPMDLGRLQLTGPAVPVVEDVVSNSGNGAAQYAFSGTGILAFQAGRLAGAARTIAWLESTGKVQPLRPVPARYTNPRLSPDGKQLAVTIADTGSVDVWIYEWERDAMSRLTSAPEADRYPVWAKDSKHLVFLSMRDGVGNLYWTRVDGAGDTVRLTESKNAQAPDSFSPDGKRLAFVEQSPQTGWDIWTMTLDLTDPDRPKPGKPEPFLRTTFLEVSPQFSPDGQWIAYMSLESGTAEVYVRPFPGPGGKWQVSYGGGMMPVWSRTARELFYRTADSRIMVAAYAARGDIFVAERPRLWSERRFLDTSVYTNFDLAPDGKRFAVMMPSEGEVESQRAQRPVTFLLNFFDELRRKAK